MVPLSLKRGKKNAYLQTSFPKTPNEVVRRFTNYQLLFSVNPKISILLKTYFLKTYYLSNSFLQSQARKCSCSHSLRPYMFRCLDTGLDNSHQCLKRKKDMLRIDGNKMSISTRNTQLYKIHMSNSFKAYCLIPWTIQKGNSFETSLVQISNGHGIIMY